jgi:hypothetical protein
MISVPAIMSHFKNSPCTKINYFDVADAAYNLELTYPIAIVFVLHYSEKNKYFFCLYIVMEGVFG